MNTNTETKTVTQTVATDVKGTAIKVDYPLFLMFAEYLGYVTPLIDWAEELCNGKDISNYKKKILMVDAQSIFSMMKKDFELSHIRELYMDYYEIVLEEYDNNLKKIGDASTDDFPF